MDALMQGHRKLALKCLDLSHNMLTSLAASPSDEWFAYSAKVVLSVLT